ncbi:hypothetical protein C8D70_102135 [Chryseobacterium sp. CBTAP 102]|nr:hypothetical protein C8D70_102135 [Chryseobacterium sp. CBTAP 102]
MVLLYCSQKLYVNYNSKELFRKSLMLNIFRLTITFLSNLGTYNFISSFPVISISFIVSRKSTPFKGSNSL